ncbi:MULTISPECIES: DUF4333 domain-containing protein [unclassified Mycolicibacterium]|uniref:DUF4333 domain-containing protein n=1 Tax=unclassified Mycolicibacterium TaxID=2636767 RepID=UPI001391A273|nr:MULTISPECIES: DUF4333 domain-containing protein [unclassified Mycolicibacterium]
MRARIVALVVIAVLVVTGFAALIYSLTRPDQEPIQAKPSAQLPMVDKASLERAIHDAFTSQPPQSVICERGLIARVGQSTRCDVTMSAAYGIQPTVTVSSVDNGKVSYSMTPAVSKTQLEAAVADMVTRTRNAAPQSVTCLSGLEGKQGAVAFCDITDSGYTSRRTALVSEVSGLAMNYGLTPVLEKSVAETSLAAQLRQSGRSADAVNCAGDVESKVGATQRCTAVVGGQSHSYTLTVTAVSDGKVSFTYQPVN